MYAIYDYTYFVTFISDSIYSYVAVLDGDGDLHTACADMKAFSCIKAPSVEVLKESDALVMDGNSPIAVLREAALNAVKAGKKVFRDPTSVPKAAVISEDDTLMSCISIIFPNADELRSMALGEIRTDETNWLDSLKDLAINVVKRLHPVESQLVVTLGEKGVLLVTKTEESETPLFKYFEAPKGVIVNNATGAGDTLCGAFIHAFLNGKPAEEAVRIGMEAASLSLASSKTISDKLSPQAW